MGNDFVTVSPTESVRRTLRRLPVGWVVEVEYRGELPDGRPFSCIGSNLTECRAKRDKYYENHRRL